MFPSSPSPSHSIQLVLFKFYFLSRRVPPIAVFLIHCWWRDYIELRIRFVLISVSLHLLALTRYWSDRTPSSILWRYSLYPHDTKKQLEPLHKNFGAPWFIGWEFHMFVNSTQDKQGRKDRWTNKNFWRHPRRSYPTNIYLSFRLRSSKT